MGPSARQLANFHTERAAMYRTIAELLGGPPTARRLAHAEALLGSAGRDRSAGASIRSAMDVAEKGGVEYEAVVFRSCAEDGECSRGDAFRLLGLEEDSDPISEMLVLASLAERAARAIRHDDLSEAAKLSALQHNLLSGHARKCLGEVAQSLLKSESPYLERVGRALDELTSEDLALLGHK